MAKFQSSACLPVSRHQLGLDNIVYSALGPDVLTHFFKCVVTVDTTFNPAWIHMQVSGLFLALIICCGDYRERRSVQTDILCMQTSAEWPLLDRNAISQPIYFWTNWP